MKNAVLIFLVLFLSVVVIAQKKPAVAKKRPIAAAKPAAAAPERSLDEKEEYQKASNLELATDRVAALQQFLKDFPESENVNAARELISSSRVLTAEEKLLSGDPDAAAAIFKLAVEEAPDPIPNELFGESIAKIPTTLYWRGARAAALDLAMVIEKKAAANAAQLVEVANFYISIENGSEALRVAQAATAVDASSELAYRTLAIAHRLNFDLEESAEAFAKALALDPNSLPARRGLAEMKRSLGKPDESIALYREILEKSEGDLPARTGLVLSLFDAGKKAEAESELSKSLEQSPGNIILLAGAAYWYAAKGDGTRAVELAQKAIDKEPRYIWSHVALARGLMAQKKPVDAEQVLIRARQYGNFPTLAYEIATARAKAGFYRDAVEELRKSFVISDGLVQTKLGGRVTRSENNFSDLLAYERRASIFTPTGADDPETALKLKQLLDLDEKLNAAAIDETSVAAAADEFAAGTDKMKLHRELYAASVLLEKKVAIPKVLELAKAATENSDSGLDVANPGAAVMATELYNSRALAFSRNEFLLVPDVPRQTLSAILRGRIEEIAGWALYQQGSFPESVVRLRRSITVLPEKSAWWRSSMWRLGAALEADGREKEALDAYIQSYKTDKPDFARFVVVESLYKKVNGSTEGLETAIGASRMMASTTASAAPANEPAPTPAPSEPEQAQPARPVPSEVVMPKGVPVDRESPAIVGPQPASPKLQTDHAKSSADVGAAKIVPVSDTAEKPPVEVKPEIAAKVEPTAEANEAKPSPSPSAAPADTEIKQVKEAETKAPTSVDTAAAPEEKPVVENRQTDVDEKKKEELPESEPRKVEPSRSEPANPEPANADKAAEPSAPEHRAAETESASRADEKPIDRATESVEQKPQPTPEDPSPVKAPEKPGIPPPEKANTKAERSSKLVVVTEELPPPVDLSRKPKPQAKHEVLKPVPADDSLFKPVIITIPGNTSDHPDKPDDAALAGGAGRMRVIIGKEIKGEPTCSVNTSEDSVSVINNGGNVGVLVGLDGDGDIKKLTARSSSPDDVKVTLEPEIAGLSTRRFFIIKSISAATGIFQVKFEAGCGRKEILVSVR